MWFRNLQCWQLPDGWTIAYDELDERLASRAHRPCGALDAETFGWLPPRPDDERLVWSGQEHALLCLGLEQKLLPASVIRDEVSHRAEEIEAQRGHPPSRKELRDLKDQVTDELLPRAFTRTTRIHAWIDRRQNTLAVDAASPNRAARLLEVLADTVGSFPLAPLNTREDPAGAMTRWLTVCQAPEGFAIERACELRDPRDEGARIRFLNHDLDGEEIALHLKAGKQVHQLGLTWEERVSFMLGDTMDLRRVVYLDELLEQAGTTDDPTERLDADFTLMTGTLQGLLAALVAALGGPENG